MNIDPADTGVKVQDPNVTATSYNLPNEEAVVFANGNLRRAGIIFKEESLDTPKASKDLVELKMKN